MKLIYFNYLVSNVQMEQSGLGSLKQWNQLFHDVSRVQVLLMQVNSEVGVWIT